MVPIIASESLSDLSLLHHIEQGILSLDFQYGTFLGKDALLHQPQKWPDKVIVMDLDAVGSHAGPNINLRHQIAPANSNIILAGACAISTIYWRYDTKKSPACLSPVPYTMAK